MWVHQFPRKFKTGFEMKTILKNPFQKYDFIKVHFFIRKELKFHGCYIFWNNIFWKKNLATINFLLFSYKNEKQFTYVIKLSWPYLLTNWMVVYSYIEEQYLHPPVWRFQSCKIRIAKSKLKFVHFFDGWWHRCKKFPRLLLTMEIFCINVISCQNDKNKATLNRDMRIKVIRDLTRSWS